MKETVVVIGLGYVGIPLAVEFGKKRVTIGFDINRERVEELKQGCDRTKEVGSQELKKARYLTLTSDIRDIKDGRYYIVAVPTPIDKHKQPDLTPLINATKIVAKVLKHGDVVIYESTVYPGCTEEECVPVIEQISGLKYNKDFFCGYSPERINPGDKKHRLTTITKITSGSAPQIAKKVDELYREIITAGTHLVSSIKVAEAAKVIENAQRDINIAFVNELAIIFNKMGIDTGEVLEAASTKWNFLPFRPGLVGGHCIGVDPYYLTHKAEVLGYHPQIILAGRRLNDNMGLYVANQVIKLMIKKGHKIEGSKVLVLGITFKENCPDVRNTRIVDIIYELKDFGCLVDVYDPWADKAQVKREYGIDMAEQLSPEAMHSYDSIIIAVAHNEFKGIDFNHVHKDETVLYDIKGILQKSCADARL
ncbi:MAG: Vi polysaccharide biosynthesis UDP-N-acetylglucosamine C-6 dehydrogenase TviB [Spirochaetales bacterium]|nr:Vi polysaccharide biosynthesis UDP-N-acetylglucosamine C-6 dehydrogenase TviB [Spirochaetales bacterium]